MHISSSLISSHNSFHLSDLLKNMQSKNQGFYKNFDEDWFIDEYTEMKILANKYADKFDDIVICGIGGSALGILTISQALYQKENPRLHVLENIDPDMISEIDNTVDYSKTLFLFISKSGGTIETLAQYSFFTQQIQANSLSLASHCVIITGKTGFLREESTKNNIPVFSVPENIGGRFSVLSAVGLFPALLLGINTDELITGAKDMAKCLLSEKPEANLSFQLAKMQFESQKPIHVLMPYSSKLRNLGLWYAQLLAESTGKEQKGYTMIPAIGPTDQHSQLQLFAEGPNDKFIIFLEVDTFTNTPKFAGSFLGSEKTYSFAELLHCERKGTQKSLEEKGVLNILLSIKKISEYELGQLFLFFEGSVALLGEMMNINAFDQPGVERGKVLAKEMLLRSVS